ncbi:TrbI/VirB10 family protein [Leptolyngbya ohadii]|uniref:TrbI/VirB10 family protein n=1 Tax=Leptolyngbya ohadii TaxID=1962290 RepID=UPI000B59EF26|nr:TrbI/VirB10 family protein [Leptolyngbya ohadii]
MKTDDQYTLITSSSVSQLDPGEFNESDDLSLEERQRLAGLDEETQSLIAPEHRIDPEVVPVKRELAQSPVSRTVFVLGSVGVFVSFGLGIAMIAGIGRSRQPQVAETPPATDSDVVTASDADLYKGRLALTDQQRDQQQPPTPAAPTTAPKRPTPPRRTSAAPARPRPVPSAAPVRARPAPIPIATRPAPPPRTVTPRPAPMPQRTQPEVNPFDQWNRLATIGSASAEVAARPVEEVSRINSSERSYSSIQQTQTDFPSDVIGDSSFNESVSPPITETVGTASADVAISPEEAVPSMPQDVLIASSAGTGSVSSSSSPAPVSVGTRGILEQREIGDGLSPDGNYQVALGTSAEAEVAVPLYWESGRARQGTPGRFAVTLTQPLMSTNGEVALPAGTTFITEAQVSSDQSRIVNQTVVAVVYEGADGQIRQEPVTPGTIVIRGENNGPLIARRHQNSDLGNDLMLGAVGALGRVGELINQGEVFSSSSSSGSSSSSTTITRNGNTNVLAAALDGFFNPLVERMQSRAQSRDADQQSTILEVNEGQPVSVFVNGLLEVAP